MKGEGEVDGWGGPNHLNKFQASYQRLVDDSIEFEAITKKAEQVMANAQAVIAKAQAFIQVNE